MAKTYKTERGLKTALKKVLGEESRTLESGRMSDGWVAVPVRNSILRVISINEKGLPSNFGLDVVNTLVEDFGGKLMSVEMFKQRVHVVDISLEVSK